MAMEVDYFTLQEDAPKDQMNPDDRETDPHRLQQRQKQIDFGKNTLGYQTYLQEVPPNKRKRRLHPSTPDITRKWSKRQFDGLVKAWRRALHRWDPEHQNARDSEPAAPVAGNKREREEEAPPSNRGGGAGGRGQRNDRGGNFGGRGGRGSSHRDRAPPHRQGASRDAEMAEEDEWVLVDRSPAKRAKSGDGNERDRNVSHAQAQNTAPAPSKPKEEDPAAGFNDEDDDWFKDI